MDDADAKPWDAKDQERDRIQPTALAGSPATALTPRSNPKGQVQPGLGEGTKSTGPPARFVPSLNSSPVMKTR